MAIDEVNRVPLEAEDNKLPSQQYRHDRKEMPAYQEPDPSQLIYLDRRTHLGHMALINEDLRLRVLDGDRVVLEPRQEGVLIYPPPQVTGRPNPYDRLSQNT